MNLQPFPAAPAATIRSLNTVESKETTDEWFNQTREFIRAVPSNSDHFCSFCLRNPATREHAKTHFIKDCHNLSQSDCDYITKLHDRALQNRLLAVEERDPDLSARFIGMVESYYGLEAQVTQPPPQENLHMWPRLRRPTKADHYCSSCLKNPATREQAKTHFIKDCHHLSQSDRNYITKLHDRALQNRLLAVEERDPDLSVRFIGMVESYYGLEAQVRQISPDDLLANGEEVKTDLSDALAGAGVGVSVVRKSGETPFLQGSVIHKQQPERSEHSSGEEGEVDESTVVSAPAVAAESRKGEQLSAAKRRRSQDLMSDVSSLEEFESGPEEGKVESEKADSPDPPPAVPAAASIENNAAAAAAPSQQQQCPKPNASPLEDDDDLIDDFEKISDQDIEEEEQPPEAAPITPEQLPASLLASQEPADRLSSHVEPISSPDSLPEEAHEETRFAKTTSVPEEAGEVSPRIRVGPAQLQTPRLQAVRLPGQEIALLPDTGNLPDGQYAIEPSMDCKASTNALTWLQPNILEVKGPPLC